MSIGLRILDLSRRRIIRSYPFGLQPGYVASMNLSDSGMSISPDDVTLVVH